MRKPWALVPGVVVVTSSSVEGGRPAGCGGSIDPTSSPGLRRWASGVNRAWTLAMAGDGDIDTSLLC
jgi:hypothetical protein